MLSWSFCGAFSELPMNITSDYMSISGVKMDVQTFFVVCTLLELLSEGRLETDKLSAFLEEC